MTFFKTRRIDWLMDNVCKICYYIVQNTVHNRMRSIVYNYFPYLFLQRKKIKYIQEVLKRNLFYFVQK